MNSDAAAENRSVHELSVVGHPAGGLAPVWTFDETVPPDLAARWVSTDADRVVLEDFVLSLIGIGGAVLSVGEVGAAAFGFPDIGGLVGCFLLGITAFLLARIARRRVGRRLGGFSPPEVDLLLVAGSQLAFDDWNRLPAAEQPREALLARRIVDLRDRLIGHPAWFSDDLATQRLRLNPAEEARRIAISCREMFDVRTAIKAELASVDAGSSPELDRAAAEWAEQLDVLWETVTARAVALTEYVEEFLGVAEVLRRRDVLGRVTATIGDRAPALMVQAAGHDLAGADLQVLRRELAELRGLPTAEQR